MQTLFNIKSTNVSQRGKTLSCPSCGLYKDCNSPKMKPYGHNNKKIMIIGVSPDKIEDKTNKLWQGRAGKLLQRTLQNLDIDLFRDCISLNAVLCHSDKQPSDHNINCCRNNVWKIIHRYKPRLILLLGSPALDSFIGHRWKKKIGNITKWRGWTIPDQMTECWVCPMFHPAHVLRDESGLTKTIWKQDMKQAFSLLYKDVPKHKNRITYLDDDLTELEKYNNSNSMIAVDYETTGIKPHARGHRIICCSVAVDDSHVYSFMLPKTRRQQKPLLDLLVNPVVSKIAHNMKFEHVWTKRVLKKEVKGWIFDTMLSTHLLDNRPGICSLKFQVYINFGIVDYDSEINPYLQAVESKNGNSMNNIHKLLKEAEGEEKLLKYCALDSLYEYRLAELHMNKLNFDFLPF